MRRLALNIIYFSYLVLGLSIPTRVLGLGQWEDQDQDHDSDSVIVEGNCNW